MSSKTQKVLKLATKSLLTSQGIRNGGIYLDLQMPQTNGQVLRLWGKTACLRVLGGPRE